MDYKNNSSYKNSNINTNKLENKNVSFWVKTISFLVIFLLFIIIPGLFMNKSKSIKNVSPEIYKEVSGLIDYYCNKDYINFLDVLYMGSECDEDKVRSFFKEEIKSKFEQLESISTTLEDKEFVELCQKIALNGANINLERLIYNNKITVNGLNNRLNKNKKILSKSKTIEELKNNIEDFENKKSSILIED